MARLRSSLVRLGWAVDPLDRPRNGHRGSALGLSRIDQLRLPATADSDRTLIRAAT